MTFIFFLNQESSFSLRSSKDVFKIMLLSHLCHDIWKLQMILYFAIISELQYEIFETFQNWHSFVTLRWYNNRFIRNE